MYKCCVCTYLMVVILGGCRQPITFTLTGSILKGNPGKYLIDSLTARLYGDHDSLYFMSTIPHSKFTIKTNVPFEGFYTLNLNGIKEYDEKLKRWINSAPAIQLYIQNGRRYSLYVDDPSELLYQSKKIVFSSSSAQNLLSAWMQSEVSISDSIRRVESGLKQKMNDAEDKHDEKSYLLYADSISSTLDSIKNIVYFAHLMKFCQLHPDNIISPHLLLQSGQLNDRHYDSLNKLYNALTDSVKGSVYAKKFKKKLDNFRRLSPGATIPEITGLTPKGDKFRFDYSKFKLT